MLVSKLLGQPLPNGLPRASLLPLLYQTPTILRTYVTDTQVVKTDKAKKGNPRRTKSRFHVKESLAQWAEEGEWSPDSPNKPLPQRPILTEGKKPTRLPSRRSRPDADEPVPFEGGAPSMLAADRVRGTTMTPNEYQTFETLFRAAIDQSMIEPKAQQSRVAPEFPTPLRALAEEATQLRSKSEHDVAKELDFTEMASAIQLPEAVKYLDDIRRQMEQATTDVALWEVLQEDVFMKVKSLRLNQQEGNKETIKSAGTISLPVLTETFPVILLEFMNRIQTVFPGSTLGLVLLPALKRLGPAAFALGATTELYNQHMRLLYRRYSDLDTIDQTLAEMDKDVYEFNRGTQELLSTIIEDAISATRGDFGSGLQAFWLMDRRIRGFQKLNRWSKAVESMVAAAALRKARERAADVAGDED